MATDILWVIELFRDIRICGCQSIMRHCLFMDAFGIDMKGVSTHICQRLVPSLPALPDDNMKTEAFIKQTMINLAVSGFVFNDEEMKALCEENSMHNVVGLSRHLPFFKKYDEADSKGHLIDGRPRFYRDPLKFGDEIVYLNSQIYEYDKAAFIKWYLRHKGTKAID